MIDLYLVDSYYSALIRIEAHTSGNISYTKLSIMKAIELVKRRALSFQASSLNRCYNVLISIFVLNSLNY